MAKRSLCFLLALLTALCCCGCGRKSVKVRQTEPSAATTEATEPPTTVPETQAPAEPPTEPPTEAPTEAPTEPPLVLHSGLREDGSFNESTLFIGDSLTFQEIYGYMRKKQVIGDARYIAICGSATSAFFDGTLVTCSAVHTLASSEFDGLPVSEAAASMGESATAIYLMWGTNFIRDGSAEDYIEILDYLLEHCPNATIHLQTVPYGWAAPYETVNERIHGAYAHYQELGEERVLLLDTFTGIGKAAASDGVHLNDTGKAKWYETIVAHAEELELSE